ncbi:Sec-independent protein translocase protein TatB [uncultured Corynebacterium sp.]|uniref:Sec-independent protein translocase protein TatB n=1 Tax=uncultured Corynebacterium sp. TaxID=159447 RepID=UPI002594EDB2|nr:Sec-independent protein translocase protein TatB [uncultured Corynebacterium sp.]
MFSSIGWGEIFFILIIGLIIIGPERLPGVIQDVRAAIYAARKAINNAKRELDSGFEEFEEFRKPLGTVTEYAALGPRRAVAKVLFDDPDADPLAPSAPQAPERPAGPRPAPQKDTPAQPKRDGEAGGFSWADIT